ncbi:MAG: ARC6/PARC6 family protein, partial [Oscillatoria sp. PMC 1050.18]|nr:ARC6/PARC6 family protein [Oscillatoria sp. PMC 1050.18]
SETNTTENTNPTSSARETNTAENSTSTNPTSVTRETNSRPEIVTSSASETNTAENTTPTTTTSPARETNTAENTTPEIVTSSARETNTADNTRSRNSSSNTTRNTAAVNTTPATSTPSLTPTRRPSLDGNTLYDRYMIAAYDASDQRNYQTALLYFQRALDERPGDSFAQQGVTNIQSNLGPTSNSNSSSSFSRELTQQQALSLVTRWTQAKSQIFAPPFEARLISDLTTGELYDSLTESNGAIAWLRNNQAYYRFGVQKIESVERFVASETKATIEVKVTEDRTLYREGEIDPSQTEFDTQVIRYSLELVDNIWKIADYKTVDGSVLERGVLNTASRERVKK